MNYKKFKHFAILTKSNIFVAILKTDKENTRIKHKGKEYINTGFYKDVNNYRFWYYDKI